MLLKVFRGSGRYRMDAGLLMAASTHSRLPRSYKIPTQVNIVYTSQMLGLTHLLTTNGAPRINHEDGHLKGISHARGKLASNLVSLA